LTPVMVEYVYHEIEFHTAVKKWHDYQEWRANRNEKRAELEKLYGLDTKHATQLVRLLRQGLEILREGTVYVDRTEVGDAEELRAIRNGSLTYPEILELAHDLEGQLAEAYDQSTLQHSPNMRDINNQVMAIHRRWLQEE
jgi:uncharacterized protein